LDAAIRLIKELQNTSGALAKKKIIQDNKDNDIFKALLWYALNPLCSYKVSEKSLSEPCFQESGFVSIFEVCEYLLNKKATSNSDLERVRGFLFSCTDDHRELFTQLLSKTLRLGVTNKTVNKVIPGLIPEWNVQQAYPIDKYEIKDGTWFALTEKLNGVRATYYKGNLYARSGEVFSGLDHIIKEFRAFGHDYVFDGELILADKGGLGDNEAFRKVTGIVNSDAVNKTPVLFTVFDVVPTTEFENDRCTQTYKRRREFLDKLIASNFFEPKCVQVLPVLYSGRNQNMIDILLNKMVEEDKEGLMLNLDVPYKCKRHNGILKIKRFYTMDLPVVRCEEGSGRLTGTLGAFVVDYKGNEVKVGSGFTDEQRAYFWAHRDELVGQICEVKYKEISKDKNTGAESLQFPVFVTLRFDKTEASFY